MKTDRKVYIINKAAHDFSAAEKYGSLIFLSKGAVNKYAVSRIFRQFQDALSTSSEDDYILLTSLTVMCVIACCIFALRHNKLNLLIFKDEDYVVRTIDLKGETNE